MRHDYGFRKVLSDPGTLNRIIAWLDSDTPRTRVAVLQMLALAAANPAGGASQVLDAFQHYSLQHNERTRFQGVVNTLLRSDVDEDFIHAALHCFVSLINTAVDLNTMLYCQMDLERAGLRDALPRLLRHSNASIARLAKDYERKLLNVDELLQERDRNAATMEATNARLAAMQDTLQALTQQRDELRQLHQEAQLRASELQSEMQATRKELEQVQQQHKETHDKLQEQSALMAEQEKQLKEVEEQALRTVSGREGVENEPPF